MTSRHIGASTLKPPPIITATTDLLWPSVYTDCASGRRNIGGRETDSLRRAVRIPGNLGGRETNSLRRVFRIPGTSAAGKQIPTTGGSDSAGESPGAAGLTEADVDDIPSFGASTLKQPPP